MAHSLCALKNNVKAIQYTVCNKTYCKHYVICVLHGAHSDFDCVFHNFNKKIVLEETVLKFVYPYIFKYIYNYK